MVRSLHKPCLTPANMKTAKPKKTSKENVGNNITSVVSCDTSDITGVAPQSRLSSSSRLKSCSCIEQNQEQQATKKSVNFTKPLTTDVYPVDRRTDFQNKQSFYDKFDISEFKKDHEASNDTDQIKSLDQMYKDMIRKIGVKTSYSPTKTLNRSNLDRLRSRSSHENTNTTDGMLRRDWIVNEHDESNLSDDDSTIFVLHCEEGC